MPDAENPTQYLYAFPAQMQKLSNDPKLKYVAAITNGFSQNFTAMLVTPGTGTNENVSDQVTCTSRDIPKEQGGGGSLFIRYEANMQWFLVTGTAPGPVWLDFSYENKDTKKTLKTSVLILVDNSDLLLYAPDGRVYQVPVSVWRDSKTVTSYALEVLSTPVQMMLNNSVSLANLPQILRQQVSQSGEALTAEPSENITCYLVNLNSLLLANPKALPPSTLLTGGSDATPPASPPSDDTEG